MASVRLTLSSAGFRELARGAEMQSVCLLSARKIAAAAGHNHAADVVAGVTRAHARAYTTSNGARAREFGGSGPLKRAISAGRF